MSEQPATHEGELSRASTFDSSLVIEVSAAIEEFRKGNPLIIVDDEGRENEGDVCFPADVVTPDLINFMAVHARGLICAAMTGERLDKLGLPLMTSRNTAPLSTAFTVSVEAAEGDLVRLDCPGHLSAQFREAGLELVGL